MTSRDPNIITIGHVTAMAAALGLEVVNSDLNVLRCVSKLGVKIMNVFFSSRRN